MIGDPNEPDARICRACPVPHVENCPECFGFGLKVSRGPDGDIPITADRAQSIIADDNISWKQCPICKGTPHGHVE
jgi:hypothetical protein